MHSKQVPTKADHTSTAIYFIFLNIFFVCNIGRIFEIVLSILIFLINHVITKLHFIEAPIFDTVRW